MIRNFFHRVKSGIPVKNTHIFKLLIFFTKILKALGFKSLFYHKEKEGSKNSGFSHVEIKRCRGRDSNPWTSAGQGPEPCAVDQAWLPLLYAPKIATSYFSLLCTKQILDDGFLNEKMLQ